MEEIGGEKREAELVDLGFLEYIRKGTNGTHVHMTIMMGIWRSNAAHMDCEGFGVEV
jgi:hypothetical protein